MRGWTSKPKRFLANGANVFHRADQTPAGNFGRSRKSGLQRNTVTGHRQINRHMRAIEQYALQKLVGFVTLLFKPVRPLDHVFYGM